MIVGTLRHEGSVTSISWIPSEAIVGGTRLPFDPGVTHYDQPPPDVIDEFQELRRTDRLRFANRLSAFIEVDGSGPSLTPATPGIR